MSRVVVGKVTEHEKETIQRLFNRKNGITELVKSLNIDDFEDEKGEALYEKIINDMAVTSQQFQKWWDDMHQQYGWPNGIYTIDFDTNDIFTE
jgi:CXXX repeat modification system protein